MKAFQETPRELGPLILANDNDVFASEYTDLLNKPLEFTDSITGKKMTWIDAIAATFQKYASEGFENVIVAEDI